VSANNSAVVAANFYAVVCALFATYYVSIVEANENTQCPTKSVSDRTAKSSPNLIPVRTAYHYPYQHTIKTSVKSTYPYPFDCSIFSTQWYSFATAVN
jgi:hypothetical protein